MPQNLKWTYRSRLLVVWNVTLRWNNWNYGEINSATGAWISLGRKKGIHGAKAAAEAHIDRILGATTSKNVEK